jgi:hypothetical protein
MCDRVQKAEESQGHRNARLLAAIYAIEAQYAHAAAVFDPNEGHHEL